MNRAPKKRRSIFLGRGEVAAKKNFSQEKRKTAARKAKLTKKDAVFFREEESWRSEIALAVNGKGSERSYEQGSQKKTKYFFGKRRSCREEELFARKA